MFSGKREIKKGNRAEAASASPLLEDDTIAPLLDDAVVVNEAGCDHDVSF